MKAKIDSGDEIVDFRIHSFHPWIVVTFLSGKISVRNSYSFEVLFQSDLKGVKGTKFTDAFESSDHAYMIAIESTDLIVFDLYSDFSFFKISILPPLEGLFSGAFLQLSAHIFLFGTSKGSLFSLNVQDEIPVLHNASVDLGSLVHVKAITCLAAISSTLFVSGCAGGILSVWTVSEDGLSVNPLRVISRSKHLSVSTLHVTPGILTCQFSNHAIHQYDLHQNDMESFRCRIAPTFQQVEAALHSPQIFPTGSFFYLKSSILSLGMPQTNVKLAVSTQGIIIQDTAHKPKLISSDIEDSLISIWPLLPNQKIVQFWQHPHKPHLLFCVFDSHLHLVTILAPRPEFQQNVNFSLSYFPPSLTLNDKTVVQLHPKVTNTPPPEGNTVSVLWPGPPVFVFGSQQFVGCLWREVNCLAVLDMVKGSIYMEREGKALGFTTVGNQEYVLTVVKEDYRVSMETRLTTTKTLSSRLRRRSSIPFPSTSNVNRKRMVLCIQLANFPSTSSLHEIELDREVDQLECFGNLILMRSTSIPDLPKFTPWTKFFNFNTMLDSSKKLSNIPNSPVLPRHEAVSVWKHSEGLVLALTGEGLSDCVLIVDCDAFLTRVQLRCSVFTGSSPCALFWHCGSLFFHAQEAISVAFVGLHALKPTVVRDLPRADGTKKWVFSKNVWVKEVRNEVLIVVSAGGEEEEVSLRHVLVKMGMLASVGLVRAALKWSSFLETEKDKNDAVSLLESLGFPQRACEIAGANPVMLLDIMIKHNLVEEAVRHFHPSTGLLDQLIVHQKEKLSLCHCERLALLFASARRFEAIKMLESYSQTDLERRFYVALQKQ